MQVNLSKRPLLAVLALVALAAATVVVAGYVDKPGQAVQGAAQNQCGGCPMKGTGAGGQSPCNACPFKGTDACCKMQCDGCPRQGTAECCKVKAAGVCDANVCPVPCTGGACAGQTAGCGGAKAESTGCAMSGGQGPAPGPCGAMGCPHAQ